jgi:uncharacterized Zn finger protein (UPF0148 family)
MDKYGVVTEGEGLTKQGSTGRTCPVCGSKVEQHGPVTICPKCGTKPFEEAKHGQKKEGGKASSG